MWRQLLDITNGLNDADLALLVGAIVTFVLTERPCNLDHFRHWLAWRAQIGE